MTFGRTSHFDVEEVGDFTLVLDIPSLGQSLQEAAVEREIVRVLLVWPLSARHAFEGCDLAMLTNACEKNGKKAISQVEK